MFAHKEILSGEFLYPIQKYKISIKIMIIWYKVMRRSNYDFSINAKLLP